MNNLKFRIWDKTEQKMLFVEGIFNDLPWSETSTFSQYESDPEYHDVVVMQFTGMVDSEGTEIYEGDLLDFDEKEWGSKALPEEVPALSAFVGEWPMLGSYEDVRLWRKVVGNVYQEEVTGVM